MKRLFILAAAFVCFARLLTAQKSADGLESDFAVAFHQEDQTIKGTVTIPAGTYVFAAFRSPTCGRATCAERSSLRWTRTCRRVA